MLDSDSDENTESPVKKPNPNRRRRGLANRLKLQNTENNTDLTPPIEAAVYTTQVNKCFSSKSGSIPLNPKLITTQVSNGSDVEEEAETGPILCKQRKLAMRQPRCVEDDLILLEDDDVIPCTPPSTKTPAEQLKSPSPPPGPPSPPRALGHAEQTRRPRMTKAVKKALSNLSQTKTQLHVNSYVDSDLNTSDVVICTEAEDDELMLKVRHGTITHRIPVMQNDFFRKILANLAQRLQVAESQILLIHNDVTISTDDTPRSLGLTTADIIDCHINRQEWTAPATDFNDSLDDTNRITLYLQSRDNRHKMEFKLDKTSPLDGLIRQYALKTDKDPSNLRLMFDGENLDLRDSADALEIEDGYTLDLIYTKNDGNDVKDDNTSDPIPKNDGNDVIVL